MTDSSATVWIAIVAGVPATLAALGNLFVILRTKRISDKQAGIAENVERIEKQTNSMNSQMVESALIKGEKAGKDKAEAAQLVSAVGTPVPPALPLLLRPDLNQDEVVKWVMQGVAIEKARRAAEGNGPKTAG